MRSKMPEIETQEYARQLLEMHGDKAVVVAAQKARTFEEKGNSKEANLAAYRGGTQANAWAASKLRESPNS